LLGRFGDVLFVFALHPGDDFDGLREGFVAGGEGFEPFVYVHVRGPFFVLAFSL
jgi:hypothetical protein